MQRIDNGKGHWYKLDGEKADGVTTLLGNGIPKPALINWAGNTTAEYAVDNWEELSALSPSARLNELKKSRFKVRDAAAKRGTEVHALADLLLQGKEVEVPDELAGHVDAYVRFLNEFEPKPVLTEFRVASRKWRYCGTADMVIDLPDGRFIADIKTSKSGIFGETALQLAAYRYADFYVDSEGAEQPMDSLGITGALGIWVRGDGYDVLPIEAGEREFKDFLHAAWVARWTGRARSLVGSSVRPNGVAA
ncbi:hypothetical protein GS909_06955 [Rhodococcus hoagii]|nr:hypothetical protein [Prescottella equi]MBM4657404.1 hypothetical protein [Prescottella equi]MBM4720218.1 hypothetical protein [Prescottella equi]MBM4720284.1 hypothetical protein [Prescottella equi]MBP0094873.1 hypothetical protein [Prescottella equi]